VQSALDEALTLVCARENRWAEALVRRDAGELLLAYGDLQAAREHLEIAAAFFRRAGAKPLLAKTEKLLVAVSDQQSAISFDP
jgi:predicted negative regulator of RcsB-dependent stress response